VGDRATVLICDDDAPLRELMRVTLEPEYVCVEATDADEALELFRATKPDAALLDVMLPGKSGIELLHEVRADPDLAAIPVIVVSAWTRESDRASASDAGADAFLGKPFEIDLLRSLVAGLIADRG
jgi:DNA-binding response OmpR family regulator